MLECGHARREKERGSRVSGAGGTGSFASASVEFHTDDGLGAVRGRQIEEASDRRFGNAAGPFSERRPDGVLLGDVVRLRRVAGAGTGRSIHPSARRRRSHRRGRFVLPPVVLRHYEFHGVGHGHSVSTYGFRLGRVFRSGDSVLSESIGGRCFLYRRAVWKPRPDSPTGPARAADGLAMRVVSLLASGTEIVCALGSGESLVGRSHECDNPAWVKSLPLCSEAAFDVSASSREIDAEVNRRLRAGQPLYTIHNEMIRSLAPDLVIAQAHCEVCAVTPEDVERSGCTTPAAPVLALQRAV